MLVLVTSGGLLGMRVLVAVPVVQTVVRVGAVLFVRRAVAVLQLLSLGFWW